MVRLLGLVMIVLALAAGGFFWQKHAKAAARAQALANTVNAARSPVTESLKDPLSAQYRNEVISTDGITVCGQLNAKNSMGGYVGFKRYVSDSKRFIVEGADIRSWPAKGSKIPAHLVEAIEEMSSDLRENAAIKEEVFGAYWKAYCD